MIILPLLAVIYAAPGALWAILIVLLILSLIKRPYGYWPSIGLELILIILLILALAGCSTTQTNSAQQKQLQAQVAQVAANAAISAAAQYAGTGKVDSKQLAAAALKQAAADVQANAAQQPTSAK